MWQCRFRIQNPIRVDVGLQCVASAFKASGDRNALRLWNVGLEAYSTNNYLLVCPNPCSVPPKSTRLKSSKYIHYCMKCSCFGVVRMKLVVYIWQICCFPPSVYFKRSGQVWDCGKAVMKQCMHNGRESQCLCLNVHACVSKAHWLGIEAHLWSSLEVEAHDQSIDAALKTHRNCSCQPKSGDCSSELAPSASSLTH